MREPIIPRRYRIVGSNSAAYSDVRGLDVMARLHRARRECFTLDGVSPALRAEASDFGKTRFFIKSHQRSSPPLIRPTDVGHLRLTLLSNSTRRWAVHGPAPLARHPASRPGQEDSPQRIRGGSKPCQPEATVQQWTSHLSPWERAGVRGWCISSQASCSLSSRLND